MLAIGYEMHPSPLVAKAIEARNRAYCPYSQFAVGAALETTDGKIFTGCNVENASYGLAICAERAAIVKAVSEGMTTFKRLAVVTDAQAPATPCGMCRQMLMEFSPDLELVLANLSGKTETVKLSELLPKAFYLKKPLR